MLTNEQKEIVRSSFEKLLPAAQTTGNLFYYRLFELDPSLRTMFISDINAQARKFVSMLHIVASNLDCIEQVMPAVEAMGRRHAGYGVEERHYDVFASALFWAIGESLEADFTPTCREAWQALYDCVKAAMQGASCEGPNTAGAAKSAPLVV